MKYKRYIEKVVIYSVVIGFVTFLVWSFFLTTSTPTSVFARRSCCSRRLKELFAGFRAYAGNNDSRFPVPGGSEGLELLTAYIGNLRYYLCPKDAPRSKWFFERWFADAKKKREFKTDYLYLGGSTPESKPGIPILFDKVGNHKNYCNVLFSDGHVEGLHLNTLEPVRKGITPAKVLISSLRGIDFRGEFDA